MHFILATVGTDGDVFPYLGLAVALRAAGIASRWPSRNLIAPAPPPSVSSSSRSSQTPRSTDS